MSEGRPTEKRMRLRYAGTCRRCGVELPARSEAVYDRSTKSVACVECSAQPTVWGSGTAGESARREHDRRRAKREERIRARHPRMGGFLLRVSKEPQAIRAWEGGAVGEERVGKLLDESAAAGAIAVLHDRRIPGSRANIDHVVVTPAGVWVVDAKRYRRQRPSLRIEGGIVRPRRERLLVGGRDRTALVESVHRQVDVVRGRLGAGIPVRGALCFVEADWPFVGASFEVDGVLAAWPRRLVATLEKDEGTLDVREVAGTLAAALPAA